MIVLSLAWRTAQLPLLDSKSRAALVFPLNIRFENDLARFCWFVDLHTPLERRFWRHLPSTRRVSISPLAQAVIRRSKQVFSCFVFGVEDGFCRARVDSTVMAFKAMGSSAEGSAYALKLIAYLAPSQSPCLPYPAVPGRCFFSSALSPSRQQRVTQYMIRSHNLPIRRVFVLLTWERAGGH